MKENETGLVLYDNSPIAELVRKLRNIPALFHNFLFPQATKPLDSQGKPFPLEDPSIRGALCEDNIGFLMEASKELGDRGIEEIEETQELNGPNEKSERNDGSRNYLLDVGARAEDDVPLIQTSRLADTISRHKKAIIIGEQKARERQNAGVNARKTRKMRDEKVEKGQKGKSDIEIN